MRRRRFAAQRDGNVPSRGMLGMSAIANLDPALRAVNGDTTHEGGSQNCSQQGAGARLESDHDAQRIAVGERAAARGAPRPYLLGLTQEGNRQINEMNAGGGKRADRSIDDREAPIVGGKREELVLAEVAFHGQGRAELPSGESGPQIDDARLEA